MIATHTKHHHSGVGFSPEFSSCTIYMQNPGTLNTASSHFACTNESVQASRHVHFHKCMDDNQLHLIQCPPSSTLEDCHISDHDDTSYGPTYMCVCVYVYVRMSHLTMGGFPIACALITTSRVFTFTSHQSNET